MPDGCASSDRLVRENLLAMYRPNFCAECGERVERRRWFPWTSRRFCSKCDKRFRASEWQMAILLTASLLGAGIIIGRWSVDRNPPLILQPATPQKVSAMPLATRPVGDSSAATGEVFYICGARTKKGTPCQRRVRGLERCWQHRGKPAMLPPEKLLVRD
jgi:hypothetical protein